MRTVIIIKSILKNIKEKKFRTFLIILSITLSSALFLASITNSKNMVEVRRKQIKAQMGTADIYFSKNLRADNYFFSTNLLKQYKDHFEYIIPGINSIAIYEDNNQSKLSISMLGIELEDLEKLNPISLAESKNLYPFSGKKVIISEKTSQKYHLSLGDSIKLKINNSHYYFTIAGIAHGDGFFFQEIGMIYAICPRDCMEKINGALGQSNILYLKLKDPDEIISTLHWLSDKYYDFDVREPYTLEDIKQEIRGIEVSFKLITALVLCVSILIIYSSFQVIVLERLPIIGTFRSIGATKKYTSFVLIMESLVYGIIGGLLGLLLGLLFSYILVYGTAPDWVRQGGIQLDISVFHMILTFILALFLSAASSIIPIIQTTKIPIKNIIFNLLEKNKEKKISHLIIGCFLLLFIWMSSYFCPKAYLFEISLLNVILSIFAEILLTPFIVFSICSILEKLTPKIFGNLAFLAFKNIKESKSSNNNIILFSLGISSLLAINTLGNSVIYAQINDFNERYYEIMLADPKANRFFENSIRTVDGVKDVYCFYEEHGVEVVGKNFRINAIQGTNDKTLSFRKVTTTTGEPEELIDLLSKDRYILITNSVKDRINAEIGDNIILQLPEGNRTYKIIGFFDSLLFSGNCALVGNKYLKLDSGSAYYYRIYVQSSKDPQKVLEALKQKFIQRNTQFWLVEEMKQGTIEAYSNVISILRLFTLLVLLIGAFAMMNNLIIAFIKRKQNFAVLRSIGMSKNQIVKMLIIESAFSGLISGTTGIIGGVIIITIFPYIMKALNLAISIHYSPGLMIYLFLGSLITMLLSSLIPCIHSLNLNIIQTIKYE